MDYGYLTGSKRSADYLKTTVLGVIRYLSAYKIIYITFTS